VNNLGMKLGILDKKRLWK